MFPLIILIFWIGIYPKPFLEKIEPAANMVMKHMERASSVKFDAENSRLVIIDDSDAVLSSADYETIKK